LPICFVTMRLTATADAPSIELNIEI